MSRSRPANGEPSPLKSYPLDVRIVETADGAYRFAAPEHVGRTFADPEAARLYADVYFAVNGFVEANTGDRGVPPEVVQAGKHALAAYLVVQTSVDWVASFYGSEPQRIERFLTRVREQAAEVRERAAAG
jgi:hypothetical protein